MGMKQSAGGRFLASFPVRTLLVVSLLAAMIPAAAVSASDSTLSSEQVAAEIIRVQGVADQTAARWSDANRRSDDLADQLVAAEDVLAAKTLEFGQLEDDLTEVAVARFTGGSDSSMLFLLSEPNEDVLANALRGIAVGAGETDRDHVDAVRAQLADARGHVQALNDENAALIEELSAREADLDQQLSELETLRERLKDEEVKRAYEELLAKQRQEEAERQAKADQQAAEQQAEADRQAAEQQAQAAAARQAPVVLAPMVAPPAAPAPAAATPDPGPAPVVAAPDPAPAPAIVAGGDGWLCPVAGPNAFGDTWGAPRSGGRTHQGVDMMSPGGTPLVAVVAGSVTMKTNALGGNVVWLAGVDGARYYYAHLSAWEGGSRSVSAGEVIGYVGSTGNTTANHLHFEIHPGGGLAINPYPTVRQYC